MSFGGSRCTSIVMFCLVCGWVTQTEPSPDPGSWGEKKTSLCRQLSLEHGWLHPETPLPESTDLTLFLTLGGKIGKASGGEENKR